MSSRSHDRNARIRVRRIVLTTPPGRERPPAELLPGHTQRELAAGLDRNCPLQCGLGRPGERTRGPDRPGKRHSGRFTTISSFWTDSGEKRAPYLPYTGRSQPSEGSRPWGNGRLPAAPGLPPLGLTHCCCIFWLNSNRWGVSAMPASSPSALSLYHRSKSKSSSRPRGAGG